MLAMMTSNSYGMMMMVNGMKQSGSYLGTVLVTASNFILSVSGFVSGYRTKSVGPAHPLRPSQALFGSIVFGEALSLWWWSGAACILGGVVLIVSESSTDSSKVQTAPAPSAAVEATATRKPKAA